MSGRVLLQKYGFWFGIGTREIDWFEKQIHKNGFWFIFVSKFHNLLRSFIPYIAGTHKMASNKFWIANILGSCIWAVSILLLGIVAIESYEIILRYVNYVFLGVIVVLFLYWFFINKSR